MTITIDQLWTSAGVLLGFQMTLFSWRLSEEAKVGDSGEIPWLTPSDYLNIVGMVVFVFGVYLLPIIELVNVEFAKASFGLGVFLFIGQSLGTAAHYQLFNRSQKRQFIWFPKQEKVIILIFMILSIVYIVYEMLR